MTSSAAVVEPSPVRAFVALVLFSFRRHLKVRQVAWVGFVLLAVLAVVIGIVTHVSGGWRLETRERVVASLTDKDGNNPARLTYRQYGEERLTFYAAFPGPPDAFGIKAAVFAPYWAAVNADLNAPAPAGGPPPRQFLDDFAFLNFVRWVVFTLYLAFLLPLFTLAYGTGALGAEREGRTLLWLTTRPLPRWAIYLAKLLGVLPWCVAVNLIGFGVLCGAGGELGRRAAAVYWPAVLAGAVAFGCLFHLLGAVIRRPTVIGLAYVFFYETLVANLPGSLKQFSLNYYVRSLFYNETAAAIGTVQPESVDVYAPADPTTAWVTLLAVSAAVTVLGAWLFGRQEPADEV
jgi:ABC-type transport system involved in multi-copper enzyme maturation permease subunit